MPLTQAGEDVLLVAVTERRSRQEIDGLAAALAEVLAVMSRGAPVRTQGPTGGGPLIDRSVPGRRAFSLGPLDVPEVAVPAAHARREAPALPEVAEIDLVRHYTRLSQMNYGIDTGAYPLGSCTMKYNPKIAETVAAFPGFQRSHPLQPDDTVQGSLEMLWTLERALCEITGMTRATLQPPAGACGEMTGLLIMRAYHEDLGAPRTKVIIPDAAHGTNPASVRLAGFEAVAVPNDERGLVDVAALERLLDDRVAGLMLTNPNTLGLFEEDIERITELVHGVGGLVYYDGANLNAILGRCRPGDMGFDIVHINTHKTFATPHGGGGPGAGPVGVKEHLVPFLPAPTLERTTGRNLRLGARPATFDRAAARVQRQLRRPGSGVCLRIPPWCRRIALRQRARGPQRELPRVPDRG